jgi:hypothetical protein
MVDVPIQDQDPLEPALRESVSGGDRDVVEQAEAHRAIGLSVMARGPQAAEGEAGLVIQQPVGGHDCAAGRVQGRVPGTLTRHGVQVDQATTGGGEALDPIHVLRRVDAEQLLALRRRRLDPLEAEPVAVGERLLDRREPPGVLGMATRLVAKGAPMADVQPHEAGTVVGLDGADRHR